MPSNALRPLLTVSNQAESKSEELSLTILLCLVGEMVLIVDQLIRIGTKTIITPPSHRDMSRLPHTLRMPIPAVLFCLSHYVLFSESFTISGRQFRAAASRRLSTSIGMRSANEEAITESTLRSITFCNLPKEEEPDVLCDFLLELGACSASVTDADAGTDLESPLFREGAPDPWTDSVQWAAPVWKRCNITAHFPAAVPLEQVLDVLEDHWKAGTTTTILERSTVPDRDWVVHVQSSWKPLLVANQFVLTFPWHTEADVAKVKHQQLGLSADASTDWIELRLQGGVAFGTGEHATTQLCLEWLAGQKDSWTEDSATSVLDYGAGSGILGLAACALGSSDVSAVGIDIDLDAVRIANANAVANQLQTRMRTYLPPLSSTDADDESKSLLAKAHAYAMAQLEEDGINGDNTETGNLFFDAPEQQQAVFDVVVANILAAPLVALSSTLWGYTRPGGRIGLSGVLSKQRHDVMDAYTTVGFRNMQVLKELDGWVLITGERPCND